jgi:hypothetical protein
MAMTINGTNGVTFNDGTSMATGQQACKAWVNFNGTGTVAIRASYNVSSITDNGTGDYTVNFTTAMPDANYSTVATALNSLANSWIPLLGTYTASSVQLKLYNTTGLGDVATINASVFR